jgi:hypothetical protein
MRNGVFIGACMWMMGLSWMLPAATEPVTVDGREYQLKAFVSPMPCDDLHPDGCRRRTVGTRKPEVAQISIVGFRSFEVTCKTVGCKDDSREEWVRIAIRRQK